MSFAGFPTLACLFLFPLVLPHHAQVAVPYPLDQEKPDAPAGALLLVATVDGVLRLYRLANFSRADAALAAPPERVPNELPAALAAVVAAAQLADGEVHTCMCPALNTDLGSRSLLP